MLLQSTSNAAITRGPKRASAPGSDISHSRRTSFLRQLLQLRVGNKANTQQTKNATIMRVDGWVIGSNDQRRTEVTTNSRHLEPWASFGARYKDYEHTHTHAYF